MLFKIINTVGVVAAVTAGAELATGFSTSPAQRANPSPPSR